MIEKIRRWAEQAKWRRRLLLCIIVPLFGVFTFLEYTAIGCWEAWRDWFYTWQYMWDDVKEFWNGSSENGQ